VQFGPEDDASIRRITQLVLAPDGGAIVFTVDEADLVRNVRSTRLWYESLADGAARPLTTAHGSQRFPCYSPDGEHIAFVAGGTQGERLMLVDSNAGRPREVLPRDLSLVPSEVVGGPGASPSIAWSPDSRSIACLVRVAEPVPGELTVEGPRPTGDPAVTVEITQRSRGGPPVRLCVVDLDGASARMIGQAERPLGGLNWSVDGQSVYAVSRAPGTALGTLQFRLLRYALSGDDAREITCFDGAAFQPTLSLNGAWFAIAAARGTTNAPAPCLLLLSVDGSVMRELSSDDLTTYSDIHWAADSSSIMAIGDAGVQRCVLRIDVASGEATAVPVGDVWIETLVCSDDGSTLAFIGSSPADPGDVWVVDSGDDTARRVTQLNPQMAHYDVARGERFTWHAEDGAHLEGIVLYPPDYAAARPAPLIIDYHGGPASHVTLGWNGQRQVFASAGYVVFAPNFRGSTGYGEVFSSALRGDIGGVPFTDCMAGVDRLIADGVVDPDRQFAFGHSWGGYMTNWTATQTDRFKAIVSSGSICDLLSVFHTRYSADVWEWRLLGTPSQSLEQYLKWSPILQVDKVRVPVLVLNGAEDRTTPPTQGLEMFTALRQRGIRSEHVVYPREGHGITEPAHQIDRVQRILRWFEEAMLASDGLRGST
jgi:dipeptidyl aminopeptidase/acylaminoacyl peptidase